MTYSSDEIGTSASRIVQGSQTFARDGLGARNIKERFQQTRELVDSVMLYEPDSVFYLIQKASLRVLRQLNSLLSVIEDLEDDVDGMAVCPKEVRDTTALADANTALTAIESALSRRGSISSAEWQRYDRATSRALSTFEESAKRTYTPFSGSTPVTEIARSSSEASVSLLANFRTLEVEHETLMASVDNLIRGFSSYDHKRVVTSVASRQVARLKDVMESLERDFEQREPLERTQTVRSDILSLLTNRAGVKALSNIRYPGDPKLEQSSTGATEYRASAYGSGTAPVIVGAVSAPWAITNSHELKIDFSGTNVTVPLVPLSFSAVPGITEAVVEGYASESTEVFAIGQELEDPYPILTPSIAAGGTYTLSGYYFYLVINGEPFTITNNPISGAPWSINPTAAQLAFYIDYILGSFGSATNQTNGVSDWVEITYGPTPSVESERYRNRYMQVATGPLNAPSMASGWRVVVAGTPTYATFSSGWDGNDELWIKPNDLSSEIQVSLTPGSWPDYVVGASSITSDINGATTEVVATAPDGHIKISSTVAGDGSVVYIDGNISSTHKDPSQAGAETLGFYLGQESRESGFRARALVDVLNNNVDFAAQATATLFRSELINTTRAYVHSANQLRVPAANNLVDDAGKLKLVVEAGDNRGNYNISSYSYDAVAGELTVTLGRGLRYIFASGLRVRIYKELLVITSRDASVSSYIDVDQAHVNSAHAELGLPTDLTRGNVDQIFIEYNDPTKGWVPANLGGLGIKEGDLVLQEDGSAVATITGIESLSAGLLDVTSVDPTLSLAAFSVESVASDNHTSFNDSLVEWRDNLSSDVLTLGALGKSINTLLKLSNPDLDRVQVVSDALSAVRTALETQLLPILNSYSTPEISAVDRALEVMAQRGHDRARILLTSAQFEEYNKTNYKTASLSGAMMEASSRVASKDLIEPTRIRHEFTGQIDKVVYSSYQEIDPKHDFRDIRADEAPVHLDYFASKIPGDE